MLDLVMFTRAGRRERRAYPRRVRVSMILSGGQQGLAAGGALVTAEGRELCARRLVTARGGLLSNSARTQIPFLRRSWHPQCWDRDDYGLINHSARSQRRSHTSPPVSRRQANARWPGDRNAHSKCDLQGALNIESSSAGSDE